MQKIVLVWWAVIVGLSGLIIDAGQAMAVENAAGERAAGATTIMMTEAAASTVGHQSSTAVLPWLEGTPFSVWVNRSAAAYATLLCLHVIGLAILVGTLIMVDLRLLNAVTAIPSTALVPLIRFASIGFIINATSGLALFVAQATTMATNVPFLTKITLIVLGVITTAVIVRRLRCSSGLRDAASAPNTLRTLAALSIVIWLGVIAAGRLIPYLGQY